MTTPLLFRSLTNHKLDYATSVIEGLGNPCGKFLIEMGMVMDKSVNLLEEEGRTEYKWLVHYFHVYEDGRKVLCQEYMYGTHEDVKSSFKNRLI